MVPSNTSSYQVSCSLKSKDDAVVQQVLQLLEAEKISYGVQNYDIVGTTIEDIFLDLMSKNDPNQLDMDSAGLENASPDSRPATPALLRKNDAPELSMKLASGRRVSPFRQAFTIFHKRFMILKRSWLTPALTVLIAIAGSCIPLVFMGHQPVSCGTRLSDSISIPLYLPDSPLIPFTFGFSSRAVNTPPGIIRSLGPSTDPLRVTDESDMTAFTDYINQNYRNLSLGGVAFDFDEGNTLVSWEGTPPGVMGLSMLNMASNVLYKQALNQTQNAGGVSPTTIIVTDFSPFPHMAAGTLVSLKWLTFFGAIMVSPLGGPDLCELVLTICGQSVYPAFFALYVSKERRSSVQAMQLSNGLSDPIGLWLGHLMFDTVFSVILTTITIIIFAAASNQFHGLGEMVSSDV